MFIGHFGLGFAAKKAAPQVSLGTLFLAVQFLDLLWPTLLLLDLEHVAVKPGTGHAQPLEFVDYPISHSLLMVFMWSVLFGFLYWLIRRNKRAAIILSLAVASHWFLDLIVHFPDLPLYPGNSPLYGWGLWQYRWITLVLEGIFFITGILFYFQATKAKNPKGKILIWVLIAFIAVVHLANIFGPPPPGVSAIAWAGHLQWLFILLAYWVDRNRRSVRVN